MNATAIDALTEAELRTLATKLDTIRDIELEAAIALTGQASNTQGPVTSRPQPRSKPPYPLHLQAMLERLYNELATTARDMSEHRGLSYGGGQSCYAVARWISDYRMSLATMPHGIELYDGLIEAIDRVAQAMNQAEDERVISQAMVEAANRSVVTVSSIEGIARKLGTEGKGLTRERMQTLIRHSGLSSASVDPDTGTKFYRLGDVLFFHASHKQRARRKSA